MATRADRGRTDWWTRFRRLARLKLVIPILRARDNPHHTARGVWFGLFVAMTPTVGVQMLMVLGIWMFVRAVVPRLSFNLVIGLAWTGTTNFFTVAPFYYLFLVTGRVMTGHWDELTGWAAFATELDARLGADAGPLESLWVYTVGLFEAFGVPMFLGSLPWALLAAWLGYRWTLGLLARSRARRRARSQTH
ncbi:MAG: DUF2062 domain-containing protein [Hyphomicrobiales bacterium]|nr:DUF2062 domain-containing protein [Hyphomicrobiales bacterium]